MHKKPNSVKYTYVIKLALWQTIIEFMHERPGAVAHAYHNNGERILGGLHNGFACFILIRN